MKIYKVSNSASVAVSVGNNLIPPGNYANIYMSPTQAASFRSSVLSVKENPTTLVGVDLDGDPVVLDTTPQFLTTVNNRTLSGLGDSLTATYLGGSDTAGWQYSATGYLTWTAYQSYRRVDLLPTSNFGVSGETTQRILARVPNVIRQRPKFCTVLAGTNDVGTMTAEQTLANLNQIYDALLDAGITVIAICILPRGGLTQEQYGKIHTINRGIRAERFRRSNFYVVDATIAIADPATGVPKAGLVDADQLHLNSAGACVLAKEIVKVINQLCPDPFIPFSNAADVYHATLNRGGNLLANGVMAGNTGTKSNTGSPGVLPTGDLATSWSANGANLPTGTSATFAKITKADERIFQQLTLGQSYNTASPGSFNVTASITAANLQVGDIIEAHCELEADAGTAFVGAAQMVLSLDYPTGVDPAAIDLSGNNGFTMPAVAHGGILKTQPLLITQAPTTASLQIRFTPKGVAGASTLAGVFRWGSACVNKLN